MLIGAIATCSLAISLFFLKFWRSTKDRFFLYFSLAFLVEAIHRVIFGLTCLINEDVPLFYLARLFAYGLILYAIIDKNKRRDNGKE